jgi:hypothetical protein
MSYEYAMSRVKDALQKSEGNHMKAQRLIMQWLEKDHSLLFGLVTPHLQGIITHAVNHVGNPVKKPAPRKIEIGDTGEFGAAVVQSLKGGRVKASTFGQPSSQPSAPPTKASKAHVDAINALVKAGKAKEEKGKRKK